MFIAFPELSILSAPEFTNEGPSKRYGFGLVQLMIEYDEYPIVFIFKGLTKAPFPMGKGLLVGNPTITS